MRQVEIGLVRSISKARLAAACSLKFDLITVNGPGTTSQNFLIRKLDTEVELQVGIELGMFETQPEFKGNRRHYLDIYITQSFFFE